MIYYNNRFKPMKQLFQSCFIEFGNVLIKDKNMSKEESKCFEKKKKKKNQEKRKRFIENLSSDKHKEKE